jgi:hypothetical protein
MSARRPSPGKTGGKFSNPWKAEPMKRQRLEELARNPNNVPGIYNYCDRWCERCAHTARCLNFHMQQEDERDLPPEARDINNAEFWKRIMESFIQLNAMLREDLERKGIVITDEELATAAVSENRDHVRASRHPLARAAMAYGDLVEKWFKTSRRAWRAKGKELQQALELRLPGRAPTEELAGLQEAVEVIRFYQYFLFPKLGRALHGRLEGDPYGDAAGSAKIALIAMDRSLGAWGQILAQFPEREAATLPLLIHLEKLRRNVEKTFPKARAFVRPGLDEPA